MQADPTFRPRSQRPWEGSVEFASGEGRPFDGTQAAGLGSRRDRFDRHPRIAPERTAWADDEPSGRFVESRSPRKFPRWTIGLAGGLILATSALLVAKAPAQNSDNPPKPPGAVEPVEIPTRWVETPGVPTAATPSAKARFEGTAAPGQVVTLQGDDSTGEALQYRWSQTSGPPAILETPLGRSTRLTVPDGADALGFLLVVTNREGTDTARLTVPIERRVAPKRVPTAVADAGDDQIALVNRQVTLNGTLSEPKGRVAFRWVQVGGPPVRLKLEDGPFFSFVPALARDLPVRTRRRDRGLGLRARRGQRDGRRLDPDRVGRHLVRVARPPDAPARLGADL